MSSSSQDKNQGLFSTRRYGEDVRSSAIAAVDERRIKNPMDRTIYREVADEFNIGEQSLRLWVKKHDAENRVAMPRGGGTPDDPVELPTKNLAHAQLEAEVVSLRKRVEKLQAENEVLKRAFVVFSSEWEK
jgi:transposase